MMQNLEKDDIQGLIARGYGAFKFACFMLVKITDADAARSFLQQLIPRLNTAAISPDDLALNIAFNADGLRKLGLAETSLSTFSREFLEGMDEEFRSLILGDVGENHPDSWEWGGNKSQPVHMLLLVYASSQEVLDREINHQKAELVSGGLELLEIKDTRFLKDNREHFGFRDGISRPVLEEFLSGKKEVISDSPPIMAGEFILGYQNEYGIYPESPTVDACDDKGELLLAAFGASNLKDLGRNGTYLVFREMNQDVPAFWNYLKNNSKESAHNEMDAAIKLGAKMVGRWPGGVPLVHSPDEISNVESSENNFSYYDHDYDGRKCPLGSHIRRTNPRDMLGEHSKTGSVEMVRKHMLLRRGRTFGEPLAASLSPHEIMESADDGKKRGLHFICLVSHIGRQFEFVQNAWVKSNNFAGLFKDGDPIIGMRQNDDEMVNDEFTCPAIPVRRKYRNLPAFTKITGGGYFFLPGINALKFISKL